MRMLISLLVLATTAIGLPGLQATERTAAAAPGAIHTVQGRGKKKRARPRKAMKTEKKTAEKKPKKNERGFEL